jgi:hypothetical protein
VLDGTDINLQDSGSPWIDEATDESLLDLFEPCSREPVSKFWGAFGPCASGFCQKMAIRRDVDAG